MTVIVCVDDDFGMMFGKRRQSQDKALRARILEITGENSLYMNEYSSRQFKEENTENIKISEDFLQKSEKGSFCFVENLPLIPFENKIEKLIVYKWNRRYPSDMKFDIPLSGGKWKLIKTEDFKGNSHDKITEEVYSK